MREKAADLITADGMTIMRQASATAREYLKEAVEDIDQIFGEGYAKAHPELIAALINTAASDSNSVTLAKSIGTGLTEIAEAIEQIAFREESL